MEKSLLQTIWISELRNSANHKELLQQLQVLPFMIIKVKTLTGKEIAVSLNNEDPIYRIKELLEEKEGIPPSQQRLIFQGKQMYVYRAT